MAQPLMKERFFCSLNLNKWSKQKIIFKIKVEKKNLLVVWWLLKLLNYFLFMKINLSSGMYKENFPLNFKTSKDINYIENLILNSALVREFDLIINNLIED